MKPLEAKLGIPFSVATAVYILSSLFGCVLYMILPPFLSSIGARVHVYALVMAATEEAVTGWSVFLAVIAHVFILVILVLGIRALKSGRSRAFCLLTGAELLLTLGFLLLTGSIANEFTSGILVNILYWLWLLTKAFPRSHPTPA